MNSLTSEPVARAMVAVSGPLEAAVMTDSKGTFHFSELPAGNFTVVAGRPGYLGSPGGRNAGAARAVYVATGPDTPSLTLRLVPQTVLHGLVTDNDEVPLEQANVHILKVTMVAGTPHWTEAAQIMTDGLGRYRASDLAPGKYCVMVNANNYPGLAPAGRVRKETWGYAPATTPCNGTQTVEAGLELKAGEDHALNLSLKLLRFLTVSGTVDSRGTKLEGAASVFLVPAMSPETLQPVTVDANGKFHSAPVAPGDYILTGVWRGPKLMSAQIPLTVADDIIGVHLKLEPAMSIPISVVADDVPDTPGEMTPANFEQAPANRPVVNVSVMRSDQVAGVATGIATRSGGVLSPVAPGVYVPHIAPMGPWYIESATHGGVDLLRDDFEVAPGADREPIYIVLRSGCAVLKGTLQGGVDSLTSIVVVPDDQRRANYQYVRPNGGTEFNLPCLAPGDYTLLAMQDGPDESNGPDAVAPYLSQGTHVTMSAGQETSVTLNVVTQGER